MEQAEQMDIAAGKAQVELDNIDFQAVALVAEWWNKWFRSAGHKRLGRIIIQFREEPGKE